MTISYLVSPEKGAVGLCGIHWLCDPGHSLSSLSFRLLSSI